MAIEAEVALELRALLASARAHLEVELELGCDGLRPGPGPGASVAAVTVTLEASPAAQVAPAAAPTVSHAQPGDRRTTLTVLAERATACTACVLHEQRKQAVFARGNPESRLVFVGEGPGRDEDEQGEPFVGRAGQLLDKMIAAMGFARDAVYICNVVKCRPPENRTPRPEEALACRQYLEPQLAAVAPEVIVALGRCAAQALGAAGAEGAWRGRWSSYQGVAVMPTYHPAFLLRSPEFKRTVWEDLQLVMKRLGIEAPRRS
jgi:uracil-DNA glycosylase